MLPKASDFYDPLICNKAIFTKKPDVVIYGVFEINTEIGEGGMRTKIKTLTLPIQESFAFEDGDEVSVDDKPFLVQGFGVTEQWTPNEGDVVLYLTSKV